MRLPAIRGWPAVRRVSPLLLLPLSAIPLLGAVPLVVTTYNKYLRYYSSPPLPAPRNALSAAEQQKFKPLPDYLSAIPVLVYHGINDHVDGYSVSQRRFAAQMQMLKLAGFHTVSIAQYARFQKGDLTGLPSRPILLTFDDGRLDSFRGADRVLAEYGFRATMFVITGTIVDRNPKYLSWTELHRMIDSGRWDVQPHAYRGHVLVAVDARNNQRPFYAVRRYLRSTGEESFATYQQRVAGDLFTLAAQFKQQGIPVYSIAVPYGDYGQQDVGNDPRIVPFLLPLMRSQFGSVFVQDDSNLPPYTTPTDGGPQKRWEARTWSTAEQLYDWLSAGDPNRAPSLPAALGRDTKQLPILGVGHVRHHQLRGTKPRRRTAARRARAARVPRLRLGGHRAARRDRRH